MKVPTCRDESLLFHLNLKKGKKFCFAHKFRQSTHFWYREATDLRIFIYSLCTTGLDYIVLVLSKDDSRIGIMIATPTSSRFLLAS